MTNVCMLDLETLSLEPNAAIVSIGAVIFDRDATVETVSFHSHLSYLSLIQDGRKVSMDTIEWWMKQSEEVRKPFLSVTRIDIKNALQDFSNLYKNYACIELWAKPSNFDIPIITSAYQDFNVQVPWHYRAVRDLYTLINLYPQVKEPEFVGERHGADTDALHQAKWLFDLWKFIHGNDKLVEFK